MEALAILVVLALALFCCAVYKYCHQPYQLFKKYGIPGPNPTPFFGSYGIVKRAGFINFPQQLLERYGPVSGYYLGSRAVVVIGDLDMLNVILLKHFDQFVDRESVPDFMYKSVGLPPGLFVAKGEQWKRSRQSIAPVFSSLNLRMLAMEIKSTSDKIGDVLEGYADSNESILIDKMFGRFTMECVLAMVFGETADLPQKEKEILIKASSILFTAVDETTITLLWFALSHFPWLESVFGVLMKSTWRGRYFRDINDACTKLVLAHEKRKRLKNKNILQLMLEANVKDESGHTRKMTVKEVVSQAITFLMAGYETTSSALGYTSYLLALNPTVQDKLHEEIENYFKARPDASLFDAAQEIEYVEMVVQESLRIFPPACGNTRHCSETTTIKGWTIPKGVTIYIPIIQLHHSPDYWVDPEKFIPERFSAEEKAKRPPFCHMPFGVGPRNCIGSRFAMMEVKMMLIQVLRRYKFVRAPETQAPLQTIYRLTMAPKHGIHLKISRW